MCVNVCVNGFRTVCGDLVSRAPKTCCYWVNLPNYVLSFGIVQGSVCLWMCQGRLVARMTHHFLLVLVGVLRSHLN